MAKWSIMRTVSLVTGASALAVTACTAGSNDDGSTPAPKPPPSSAAPRASDEGTMTPALPSARRWVGMDGVIVAVPENWATVVQPCGQPAGDIVLFLGPSSLTMDCGPIPTDGVSSLTIAAARSGVIRL